MAFGFIGSSRTGKSTLAKRVADDMGFHYFDASFGKMAEELGFGSSVARMSVLDRMTMQEAVLTEYIARLNKLPRPFVTDRTPLDMIGYTLGEVTMHSGDVELGRRINRYVDRCISVSRTCFDAMVILRPLPVYVADAGKPPPDPSYQRLVQFIIEGAFEQITDQVSCIVLDVTDFEMRVEGASEFLARRCDRINVARARAICN